ncbi:hypothetical protein DY000_02030650 [Brassica cretica]|uniref:Uncharacterized protein n=1 Tax=Brassica cretica TaxID=69181 RepID=A0ABQ7DVU3_BRACR|nr:hypothetical protein DY000_02030650 [Brassica cretica]
MAVDEQTELPEATPREAKLQTQLDGIQSQITELNRTREEVMENPELSSEVQSLKEKLDEHSKKLEQSAEKLSQLESENLTLRDGNQALNTTINKKHRFRAQSQPMPTLETPNSGTNATLPHTASESEPEPDKEAPKGAAKTESPMVAYLEQMFSKRLDAMLCMVERLPKVAPPPPFGGATPTPTPILLSQMSSP